MTERSKEIHPHVLPLTVIRTVFNTGFRMIYPFQPFFINELGISLGQITRMLAGRSLLGIFSPLMASIADSRGRKTGMLAGAGMFCAGALGIILWPTAGGFFLFLLFSMIGKSVFDPSLQAYFGDRVAYERRGFVLALTEMSWSGAFFLGMPLIGFLIKNTAFLVPFSLLAALCGAALLVMMVIIPADPAPAADRPGFLDNLGMVWGSAAALAGLLVTFLIASANEVVNVVFGVWLNDSFALQITALGGASAVIGFSELLGEGAVSAFADRLSKKRAVLLGALGSSAAGLSLILLGRTRWGAVLGLFFFYLTFEFTIVSIIPMMTGVLPEARATLMALNIASMSLGRGVGSLIAAPLYRQGFVFNALTGAVLNLLVVFALRLVHVKESGRG